MSLKNRDNHNRWRNKTFAFRVSLRKMRKSKPLSSSQG